ncbi:hypothetical protein AC578_612 [Pseudocercospora eumusae]|uniref:Uncharacterized protein n=1 Tax=Pseudocercospora eumusae TaxID=321146 RepID=A0A139HFJ5_9PEZI|nr:hypothetical protein AC578_612 [Pseudocercospora eumusae]
MCKVQQRIHKCNHRSEHHLSNCLNHTRCMAQQAWSGYPYITIFTTLECPPCQFQAKKSKYMDKYRDTMSSTRDLGDDLTEALELEYPQMPLIISQNKRPGLRKYTDFKVKKSRLSQSMTPDDCEVRRISRSSDINVFEDEGGNESQGVGVDGECDEDPISKNCDRSDIDPDDCAVDDDQGNDLSAKNTIAGESQHTAELTSINHVKLVKTKTTISKVDYRERKDSGKEVRDSGRASESPQPLTPCQSTLPTLTACQTPRARNENLDNARWRDTDGLKTHDTGMAQTTQLEPPPRNLLRRVGFKKSENPMREYWRRKDSGEQMW